MLVPVSHTKYCLHMQYYDVSSFNSSLTTAPHFKNAHLPPSSTRHPLAQVNSLVTETNVAARKVAATPALADGEYNVTSTKIVFSDSMVVSHPPVQET